MRDEKEGRKKEASKVIYMYVLGALAGVSAVWSAACWGEGAGDVQSPLLSIIISDMIIIVTT